jgi:hypothetical protein
MVNRVSFEDPISSVSYKKALEILPLLNNKTQELRIIKASSKSVSNNYANTTKTTLSSIVNTFNICFLMLFIILYFLFVFVIQLLTKHYMELE